MRRDIQYLKSAVRHEIRSAENEYFVILGMSNWQEETGSMSWERCVVNVREVESNLNTSSDETE